MILLTGFEPFGTFPSNPAGEVAKALDGRAFGAEVVRSIVLPVHHADAALAVARLIEETPPRAIVHRIRNGSLRASPSVCGAAKRHGKNQPSVITAGIAPITTLGAPSHAANAGRIVDGETNARAIMKNA